MLSITARAPFLFVSVMVTSMFDLTLHRAFSLPV
jgi:hypothetical protein